MNNLIVHVNRTFLEVGSNEYTNQFHNNVKAWHTLKDREKLSISVEENAIKNMMKLGADFWLRVENLNPYKAKSDEIMISLSLNYIGTNKFYGYVTKDFYNNLLETFSN